MNETSLHPRTPAPTTHVASVTHGRRERWLRDALLLALTAFATSSCVKHDLTNACLPLKAPATVRLVRPVQVFPSGRADIEIRAQPIKPLDQVLPAGTRLHVGRISQTAKVDVSLTNIDVFGRLDDGRTFYYMWGYGQDLDRAPWEDARTPALRTMPCALR